MACPYFLPAAPLAGFSDLYDGACSAETGAPIPADLLRSCCNNGYARDVCARAAESDSDAFRFLIKAHRNGLVEVAWSSERNHHPVAVGSLSLKANVAATTPLESQARIHADNYLRQIGSGS